MECNGSETTSELNQSSTGANAAKIALDTAAIEQAKNNDPEI